MRKIEQDGQAIYQLQLAILDEGAQIDKIKADFLNKISFAKVAVDLSFKSFADEDPYVASLTKQMVSQIGTMEYMVNAIFSTNSLQEMQAIQRNAVSIAQMILSNSQVLLPRGPDRQGQ